MKKELQEKCNLQVNNTVCFKKNFKWDYTNLQVVGALALTLNRAVAVDSDVVQLAKEIKKKSGVFSDLTSYLRLPASAKMYVNKASEQYLNNVLGIYDRISGSRLASMQRMTAAMIISEYASGSRLEQMAERTNEIFDLMKKNHSFLADASVLPMAAFLAVSTNNAESAVNHVEQAYEMFRDCFGKKKTTYRLAALTALSEGFLQSNCEQVMELHKTLKLYGHSIGQGGEMVVLGSLVGFGVETRKIVEAIIDVDEYLLKQKGYSNFAIGEKMRLSIASLLVLSQCEEDYNMAVSMLEESSTEGSLLLNAGLFVCIQNAAEAAAAATAAACC